MIKLRKVGTYVSKQILFYISRNHILFSTTYVFLIEEKLWESEMINVHKYMALRLSYPFTNQTIE